MDVLDVDTVGRCTVFEDDLLQEHEGSLVLCMLSHLQQPGIHDHFTRMETVQQRHPQVTLVFTDGMIGVPVLCACTCARMSQSQLLLKHSDHPQGTCLQSWRLGKQQAACKKLGTILARRQSRCLGLLLP